MALQLFINITKSGLSSQIISLALSHDVGSKAVKYYAFY